MKIAVLRGVNLELQLLNDSLRSWKTCENGIKICQKSRKVLSKSIKNLPKFYPGGVWGPFGLPRSVLGPIWTPIGAPHGVVFEAKWGSCWGHVGSKIDFRGPGWPSKATMKFDTFLNRFGTDFGSSLGCKMGPKSVQDRFQERS